MNALKKAQNREGEYMGVVVFIFSVDSTMHYKAVEVLGEFRLLSTWQPRKAGLPCSRYGRYIGEGIQ